MALTAKPKRQENRVSEQEVSALINKGGTAATPEPSEQEAVAEKQVALRIPKVMLDRVDQMLEKRTIRMPRHTWILEAIVSKLESEEQQT